MARERTNLHPPTPNDEGTSMQSLQKFSDVALLIVCLAVDATSSSPLHIGKDMMYLSGRTGRRRPQSRGRRNGNSHVWLGGKGKGFQRYIEKPKE
jgi:hypothetical protein